MLVAKKRSAPSLEKGKHYGGTLFQPKLCLIDKNAEGSSMFLSGPVPTLATVGSKRASQSFKWNH